MRVLAWRTDPGWIARVLPHRDELLLEQAHLERKAAAQAVNFLFGYQDHPAAQAPLAALAREELGHFELVLQHLARRGLAFRRQRPGRYAAALQAAVRTGEPGRGLDLLLVSALIEARSCERMQLLARALAPVDAELAELYAGLVQSEARHHAVYVELAGACFPDLDVAGRLAELAAHEAAVVRGHAEVRLHG